MKTPFMVCAVLDIVPRAVEWDDHTLHRFFYRLGKGGVDYLRIFPFWDGLKPYRKRPSGKYDLDLWNPAYFDQLKRVCDIAHEWRIAIYFDLFDHCYTKKPTRHLNPWYSNVNNVDGIYEYDSNAMRYYKQWIKKVWDTVGKRGYWKDKFGIKHKIKPNLYGLGNELHATWANIPERHKWGDTWGYGLAEYIWKLGYRKEVMWSAEQKTNHALRAYLDKDDPWVKKYHPDCPFSRRDTVAQYHGWIIPHDSASIVLTTTKRKMAYSDDGVNCKEDGDGICVEQNGKKKYCSAPTRSVIDLCRFIKDNMRVWQFHHIEQLPRSVSEVVHSLDDVDQHRDVNIYRRITKQVWGVDITRKYPRWLREKHGIRG